MYIIYKIIYQFISDKVNLPDQKHFVNKNSKYGSKFTAKISKTNVLPSYKCDPSVMAWAGPSGSTLQCPIYGFVSKHDTYVLRNMDRIPVEYRAYLG